MILLHRIFHGIIEDKPHEKERKMSINPVTGQLEEGDNLAPVKGEWVIIGRMAMDIQLVILFSLVGKTIPL